MYKITIETTREVKKTASPSYGPIGEKNGEKEWGYPPEAIRTVTETVEVLRQVVDEIDLPAVIKAINKL